MKAFNALALGVVGFFLIGLVGVPVYEVIARASSMRALTDPLVISVAALTFAQAVVSTLISVFLGLPLGLAASKSRAAQRVLALPYGVPTLVAAAAWTAWLGRAGILSSLGIHIDISYSIYALILAHVFFNVPWVALLVAQARARVAPESVEAARTLGAGRFSVFRFVVWPEIHGAVASSAAQVLALCSMSFVLVLLLGGGPPVETLETALFAKIRYGNLDVSGAAACAVWEILITLGPWALFVFFQRRKSGYAVTSIRRVKSSGSPLAVAIAALFILPYFAVFSVGTLQVLGRRSLWVHLAQPLKLTLELAFATSVGAVLIAAFGVRVLYLLRRYPRTLALGNVLITVPSGISVLVLGLGFWLGYGRWIDPFSGSLMAMILVQTTLFVPVAFRVLNPCAEAIEERLLEAAATLGASPWRAFWTVEWPRFRTPVFTALAWVAGASIGEVAAVSLFYSENLVPLPLMISRWMSQYRFEEAQAVSGLLLLVSIGVIAVISYGRGDARERIG